jgi:enolase
MSMQSELLLQDCAYEGYDGLLVDLAVGLDCFSNLGSIAKFDRVSKLNRMREILEDFKQ